MSYSMYNFDSTCKSKVIKKKLYNIQSLRSFIYIGYITQEAEFTVSE